MGASFMADFSGVRVHHGQRPTALARQLGARAFTVGGDVFFGDGQFNPSQRAGRRLLAHELTHVLQQNDDRVIRRAPAELGKTPRRRQVGPTSRP